MPSGDRRGRRSVNGCSRPTPMTAASAPTSSAHVEPAGRDLTELLRPLLADKDNFVRRAAMQGLGAKVRRRRRR